MKEIYAKETYFVGASGENRVQSILNSWKIATTKISDSDFGEDVLCDIFISSNQNTYIRTNLTFRVQIKSSASFIEKSYIRKTSNGYSFSLDKALLRLWLDAYYPIILIIWDQKDEKGYWCIPGNDLSFNDVCTDGTKALHFYKDLLSSETEIKEYIEHYYMSLYKSKNSQNKCSIYPIWMPSYRHFTYFEIQEFFGEHIQNNDIQCALASTDYLPSFLTPYPMLNIDGLSCLEYKFSPASLSEYIAKLYNYFPINASCSNNEWVSYIVSPIEVLSEENRVINRLTDWTSYAYINNTIYSDFEYCYNISDDFYETIPVRATSDSQQLYIHKSGDFATMIGASGYALASRIYFSNQHKKNIEKCFCVWDISNCSKEDLMTLDKWCNENDISYSELGDDEGLIIISHPMFINSGEGIMYPGIVTWKEFDNNDFQSQNFIKKIPVGNCPEEHIMKSVVERYIHITKDVISDEFFIQKESYIRGEVLNHSNRIIYFISYIKVDNIDIVNNIIDSYNTKINENNMISNQTKLYIDKYTDFDDLILEIHPKYNITSKEAINHYAEMYSDALKLIKLYCKLRNNMAYDIKYKLDRYLPEHLIKEK